MEPDIDYKAIAEDMVSLAAKEFAPGCNVEFMVGSKCCIGRVISAEPTPDNILMEIACEGVQYTRKAFAGFYPSVRPIAP